MKIMTLLGKAYMVLVFAFLTCLGVIWSFFPEIHMPRIGVEVSTVNGFNTLKSVMCTGLFGLAFFALAYLRDPKTWFAQMFGLTAIILVVRVVSLVQDGFHDRIAIYAGLELLILLVLLMLRRLD